MRWSKMTFQPQMPMLLLDGNQDVAIATNVTWELDDDVDCDFNSMEELNKVFRYR